jgi:hypothetical protein
MEEVAAIRRAALDAVDDVEPGRLRERIEQRLTDGSMAPGVLTVLSARAVHEHLLDATDREPFPSEAVTERGAGVQLIYEGLGLTRSLVQEDPWGVDASENGHDEADIDADMAILVADILVARGFYLLARTEAADAAVDTVRAFGRDQTTRRVTGDASLDRNLEADVFELAVVTGTTAVGGSAPGKLREYAMDLARTNGSLPVADGLFSESTVDTLSGLADGPPDGGNVATSADH